MGNATAATAALLVVALIVIVICLCAIVQIVGTAKVCKKLDEPAWGAVVPFYATWCVVAPTGGQTLAIASIACSVGGLVLPCVPFLTGLAVACYIASFVLGIVTSYRLAQAFDRGIPFTIGLVLLPCVFMCILGFGSDEPVDDLWEEESDEEEPHELDEE